MLEIAIIFVGLGLPLILAFVTWDLSRLRVIRFRRLHRDRWEIAFSMDHLNGKLGEDFAEIHMPAEPYIVQAWLWLRPRRGIEMQVGE